MSKLKDAIPQLKHKGLSKECDRTLKRLFITFLITGALLVVSTGMWQFLVIAVFFFDTSFIALASLDLYDSLSYKEDSHIIEHNQSANDSYNNS